LGIPSCSRRDFLVFDRKWCVIRLITEDIRA
jgi:hypothetical protein